MSDQWLKEVINQVPFAQVVWAGNDGNVATVLCRVVEAQQRNWDELCFRWLETVKHSRLLLARQMMVRQGVRGYLWNVSLFSNDFSQATSTMMAVTNALLSNAPNQQAGPTPPLAGKVEHQPEYQKAQSRFQGAYKPDAVQGRHVANARGQGLVHEVVVPLPGGQSNRNIPTGTVTGAGGQPLQSIRGAYGISDRR
jgi:hypothetical protein